MHVLEYFGTFMVLLYDRQRKIDLLPVIDVVMVDARQRENPWTRARL